MSVEKKLSKLHELLTDKLTAIVKNDEVTASELNVVRQFLKDNNIDAIPTDDSALGKLMTELPEDFKTSFNRSH